METNAIKIEIVVKFICILDFCKKSGRNDRKNAQCFKIQLTICDLIRNGSVQPNTAKKTKSDLSKKKH